MPRLPKANYLSDLLMSMSQDFIFVHPLATPQSPARFLEVNQYCCERLGYSKDELLALGPLDLLDDEEIEPVTDEAGLLVDHKVATFEKNILAKSGEKIPCEIKARAFEHQGETLVISVGREISGRKKAEASLRLREQQYRSVAEDTPVMMCTFLPGGEIVYVNKAYCSYHGKEQDGIAGHNFLKFIPQEDREKVMGGIAALTQKNPVDTQEHRVIDPSGEVRWQRWTNRALFDDTGRVRLYQSYGEDITAAKHYEAEREITLSLLQAMHNSNNFREFIQNVTSLMQSWSECEAVGIRLQDGGDYPYYETRGFPKKFIEAERQLCARDRDGQPLRDNQGNAYL
jgi:PAS domain S-box-containing protein